jgi:type VI secretion system protein ImpL
MNPRSQINRLKFAVGLGSIMSFYGIVSFIVWMIPPGTMRNQYKIVTIGLILLTLPFVLLFSYIGSRRARKKAEKAAAAKAAEASETAPADAAAKTTAAPTGTYDDLDKSTEEAVQFLKGSNLGGTAGDPVFSLPWYLVAGIPRAGKSSLVLSSDLNFHNLPSQRQSEMKFIRPTRNIDWRITSEAVFVDTAGRYQTEGVDADEWSSLLETLKKHRSGRPIDGLILTVNTESILKSDEKATEEIAKVLRSRIDDAMARLKVKFPIYVVFTHADAIEGFRDSFSSSKQEDKTLVWGATFPIEKSENAQALFDSEFEILQNSLMKRRLARLSAPFPPVRQLRIFNFPLHFGAARRKFGAFINTLFRPNPFSENPFLRGFYFTAALPAKGAGAGAQTVANGYFAERFFRDVVLRDKDLVRTFIAHRKRPPIFGWVLTTLSTLIVLILLAMTAVSLFTNKQMLADAELRGTRLINLRKSDSDKDVLQKSEDEVRKEMAVMEDIRPLLTTLDEYDREGPPIYMRFGMYTGNRILKDSLLPNYYAVVEKRFRAPTIRRMEAELRKFADGKPIANPGNLSDEEEAFLDKHYNLLKAYLMLSGDFQDKAEATHIVDTIKEFWLAESKVPADMRSAAQQHLELWARQVDRVEEPGRFPRFELNEKLVADARTKLQAFPAIFRYYSNRVTEISKELDDNVGAMTVADILARAGSDGRYVDGTYRVKGAFTRPGYEMMKKAILEADERLSADDWVMGETGKREIAGDRDTARLNDRYHRDYAEEWINFVKGVDIRRFNGKSDAVDALQTFASPNSPLKVLAEEISRNTNLSADPPSQGIIEWVMSKFRSAPKAEGGGTEPEKEFRPLFDFIGTPEAKDPPMARYLVELNKVQAYINRMPEDKLKSIGEELVAGTESGITTAENNINGFLNAFGGTTGGQEMAQMFQRPLNTLKMMLGAGLKQQLEKTWTDQILVEAREVEKGYPFEETANETDLKTLTAYLNPSNGRFSKFYDDRLSMYFEESGGQYRVRENSELQFSDEFVAYVNNAMALRRALFGTSAEPKFDYVFTLKPVPDALIEVTIDGQRVTSEGTGSINGTFPSTASETGVLVSVVSTSGGDGAATGSVSDATGCPPRCPGTWGLFRFVDSARPQKLDSGEYQLTFSAGGKTVIATIRPSGGDLFDRSIFRNMKAPQSFLK